MCGNVSGFPASWGKIDCSLKAGAEWNTVPFPLLILPEANLSYITQRETFNLINNMEFLNDRYASMSLSYDMNGKLIQPYSPYQELEMEGNVPRTCLVGNIDG